jgi:hypothetical protein
MMIFRGTYPEVFQATVVTGVCAGVATTFAVCAGAGCTAAGFAGIEGRAFAFVTSP